MMFIILLLTSFFTFAEEPIHWNYAIEVKDIHEFYKNHELISKPKDSWQTLFSLTYIDSEMKVLKDCVYFRVPGNELGVLKIKTVDATLNCDQTLLAAGDKEVIGIKTLQYAIFENKLAIDFSTSDFKLEKWSARLQNSKEKKLPKLNVSSAEIKGPKIIFLAPRSKVKTTTVVKVLKENSLCHNINEDCEEVTPSICGNCENGWYEIPTGCSKGPKFCGILNCGGKNQPACRRGMKWNSSEGELDCRTNSSFAFCAPNLSVQCEGNKAYCR